LHTHAYLLYAWLVRVEERPGLYMLRDEFTTNTWDLLPMPKNSESQVFFCLLLQTCKPKIYILFINNRTIKMLNYLYKLLNVSPLSSSISVTPRKTRFATLTLPPGP